MFWLFTNMQQIAGKPNDINITTLIFSLSLFLCRKSVDQLKGSAGQSGLRVSPGVPLRCRLQLEQEMVSLGAAGTLST